MNEVEIIDKAISLLQKGWAKKTFWKDSEGNCLSSPKNACAYCMVGAVLAAIDLEDLGVTGQLTSPAFRPIRDAMCEIGNVPWDSWSALYRINDDMDSVDQAIHFLNRVKEQFDA